jgi:transcriptional repressor NrdR
VKRVCSERSRALVDGFNRAVNGVRVLAMPGAKPLYIPCYNQSAGHWPSFSSMKCPFCGFENDKVVDSRESKEGESIRRRRECLKCEKRFTTYERIDEIPYMVVKKDGRREKFERQKVLAGLLRACEKRPVSMGRMEQIVNDAEGFVVDSQDRERKTSEIGELIMNRLKRIDKVAYVRFASVYLDFKDVREFMEELKELLDTKENSSAKAKSGN